MSEKKEILLPILRDDLKLLEATPSEDGSKQWMIFDPIANRYFNIDLDTFELLNHWENGMEVRTFVDLLHKQNYEIVEENLIMFISFLKANSLVKSYNQNDTKLLFEQNKKTKQSFLKWLVHNYLFIKVPLVKPDKWLNRNYKKIDFLYSNIWSNFVLILGFVGIILVLRQWEEFFSTFIYFFSKEGMLYYFLSLVFVKSVHELGHAFTSKRYGCKVPSMGVAFLVMFPVLYTDTTNAYALKSKYTRLKIVVAGVKVELYLALIATFLWSFLPEGALKSIAFIIATTSWITSLLINISPFLRFDGYYFLSDVTNTKNLQSRSFSYTRWFLRHYLLGTNELQPEILSLGRKRFFLIYAISTWIYRFVLFLGIAVLVYYFAFKVLGIILFLIEILWFVFLPIFNELKVWWEMKKEVKWNRRNVISSFAFFTLLFVLLFPWSTKLNLSAVVEAQKNVNIYASKPAQIEKIVVKNSQFVKKDDILIILESKDLEFAIKNAQKELDLQMYDLDNIVANEKNLENRFILQENILKKREELDGLLKLKEELTIKAPFDGVVYFNDNYRLKQWVNPKEPILNIYDNKTSRIVAYCDDININQIQNNMSGKFIANNGMVNFEAVVYNSSKISLTSIDYKELSSEFGGDIATRQMQVKNESKSVSEIAYFKIEANLLDNKIDLKTRIDGKFVVEINKGSILKRFFYFAYNIIVKESGF